MTSAIAKPAAWVPAATAAHSPNAAAAADAAAAATAANSSPRSAPSCSSNAIVVADAATASLFNVPKLLSVVLRLQLVHRHFRKQL